MRLWRRLRRWYLARRHPEAYAVWLDDVPRVR